MRSSNKKQCWYKNILLLFPFLAALLTGSPVFADGAITGSFGATTAPVVSGVVVHVAGTQQMATTLNPQVSYDVKVTVSDADGIGELDTVVVKLFADSSTNGSLWTQTDFNTHTGNEQSSVVITWDRGTNTAVLNQGSGSTWALVSSTLPTSLELADEDDISHVFIYRLTIGKTALETKPTNEYHWHVGALATDSGELTGYDRLEYLTMNWFGEIDVPEGIVIDWGDLPPDTDFSDTIAREAVGQAFTYLTNGSHAYTVKSSTAWNATEGGGTVYLSEDPLSDGGDHFALKAYSSDSLGDAVLFDEDGSSVNFATSGSGTTESGASLSNQTLWIKLSDTMTSAKVYSGTITFGIANN